MQRLAQSEAERERERQADRSTDKANHDALLHLNVVSFGEIEVTEHPESYT